MYASSKFVDNSVASIVTYSTKTWGLNSVEMTPKYNMERDYLGYLIFFVWKFLDNIFFENKV